MLLPVDAEMFSPPQRRRGDIVVTRYADAVAVLRESSFGKPPLPWVPIRTSRILLSMFLALDPPVHTRLRKVVTPLFTPPAVAAHRDTLHELADRSLDRASPTLDVVGDYAYPLSFSFICTLTGAREQDWWRLSQWTRILTAVLDEPIALRASDVIPLLRSISSRKLKPVRALRAGAALIRYARGCIATADAPITDALRTAVATNEITDDEAVSTWLLLFLAGHETTANLIANTAHALATHPDELDKVRRDPSLISSAVGEALRWDPPVPLNARTATSDTTVGGDAIKRGGSAFISVALANRDPDIVEDGDEFRVARSPTPPHLAFGLGTHFCLGAFLARVEAEVALEHLLDSASRFELAAPPVRRATRTVSGFDSLQLRVR